MGLKHFLVNKTILVAPLAGVKVKAGIIAANTLLELNDAKPAQEAAIKELRALTSKQCTRFNLDTKKSETRVPWVEELTATEAKAVGAKIVKRKSEELAEANKAKDMDVTNVKKK